MTTENKIGALALRIAHGAHPQVGQTISWFERSAYDDRSHVQFQDEVTADELEAAYRLAFKLPEVAR